MYGKRRLLKLQYFCGKVEYKKYTMSNYWAAAANKLIKSYGVK